MPSRASRARLHRARCTTTASEATEVLEHESPGAARYWGGFFWPRDDHRSATRAVLVRASRVGVGLSSLFPSTIAAPCAGRTVAGVIAIRAHPGAVDPDRKKPRQFQRGFKAAACTLRHERRAWTRGLRTRSFRDPLGYERRLRCTHDRRRGCMRTHPRHTLPLAVFPHPCCSPRWITIWHTISGSVRESEKPIE